MFPLTPISCPLQCGMDPYIILPEKAECVDQQTLKMQVGGPLRSCVCPRSLQCAGGVCTRLPLATAAAAAQMAALAPY